MTPNPFGVIQRVDICTKSQSSRLKKWVVTERRHTGTHLIKFGHFGKSCLDSKWHDLKNQTREKNPSVRGRNWGGLSGYGLLCGDSTWTPTAPSGPAETGPGSSFCFVLLGLFVFFNSNNSLVFFSWWFSCVSVRLPRGPPCPHFPVSGDRWNQPSGGSKGTLYRSLKALSTLMRLD